MHSVVYHLVCRMVIAHKKNQLLILYVDYIFSHLQLFLGVARQDAFQSPVGVTKIGILDI